MTTAFDLHFDEVNAAALKLFPGLLYQRRTLSLRSWSQTPMGQSQRSVER